MQRFKKFRASFYTLPATPKDVYILYALYNRMSCFVAIVIHTLSDII